MRINSKLIIVRGPAGSGKSTVSREVQEVVASTNTPIALLEQDYYRERLILPKVGTRELRNKKLYADAAYLLSEGCNVIIEGSIDSSNHKALVTDLLDSHPRDNAIFYFNIPLEETIRRDRMRRHVDLQRIEVLKSWYRDYEPMGFNCEYEISSAFSKDDVVQMILSISGLAGAIRRTI